MATTTTTATIVAKTTTSTAAVAKKKNGTKHKKKQLALPPFSLNPTTCDPQSTPDHLLESVAKLLEGRKNIVVLVGAGISTSVGIPDFRSKDKGLYNTLDAHTLGLSCPEDLFCVEFFKSNPVPFYKFAKHLYYPNRKNKEEEEAKTAKNNAKNKKLKARPLPARSSSRIKSRKRPLSSPQEQQQAQPDSNSNSGRASPSDSHKLLALLEKRKMLLRVYTQNIDGLEASAGVSDTKIVYCHGSLRTMSCTKCSKKNLPLDKSMLASIEEGIVPTCKIPTKQKQKKPSLDVTNNPMNSPVRTSKRTKRSSSTSTSTLYALDEDGNPCCGGVLKPSITFFGETLDNSVGRKIEADQQKADALIVIGTSLSVAPISKVIEYLPRTIPRILINQTIVHPKTATTDIGQEEEEDFRQNYVFDAYLLGFCDDVTRALGKQLGLGSDLETKKDNKKKGIKKESEVATRYASETGAKIWNEGSEEITVPKERVLLFPGALPLGAGPKQEPPGAIPAEAFHEIAHCDGCSKQISSGSIFKCSKCFDYDLCQSCYPKISKTHCGGKHAFRKE